jgi:hypothetical protein
MNIFTRIRNKILNRYQELNYYRKFFSTVDQGKEGVLQDKRVLMYVGIGHMYLTPLEIMMYHILRSKGYEVDYYIYDESVQANEVITKQVIETQGKEKFWRRSVKNAREVLHASKVDFKHITTDPAIEDLLQSVEGDLAAILAYQHAGIDFGDIVRGVLYRYYKSLSFGEDAAVIAWRFLRTALTNYYMVRKLHDSNHYHAVFFSHGIYCTWQPVVSFCAQRGLRYICYDRAKRAGSSNFNVSQPSPDWSFDAAWKRFEGQALTSNEEAQVSQYLGERELQKGDVYAYNDSVRAADINQLKQQLSIPLDRKIITIFTNLIWDAANVSRDIAFPSAFQCIIRTIEHYQNRSDVQVVIRSHPAEKVLGTRERYGHLVRAHFKDQLPDYVTIIEPEMSVNSFSVIDMSSIGVVNTSTVGLEFAMMGKPIVLISETNYRGKGFTYDATGEENYFETISSLLDNPTLLPNQVNLARKYFYMMMFLYQKQMPMTYEKGIFKQYTYTGWGERDTSDQLHRILDDFNKSDCTDFIYWRP